MSLIDVEQEELYTLFLNDMENWREILANYCQPNNKNKLKIHN